MPIGYHFHNGKTLRNGNALPAVGQWLEHTGPIVMCESGLHGSDCPFDALQYAPGPWIDLVEYEGEIQRQHDKWVARKRRTIKRVNLTDTLRYFARMQAVSVIMNAPADMQDVVLDWLMTGDESLCSAARSAAMSAAGEAAWSAACSAASSAARSAAESAARSAAWSAAESAAESAWLAAWSAAQLEFSLLVNEALECCDVA